MDAGRIVRDAAIDASDASLPGLDATSGEVVDGSEGDSDAGPTDDASACPTANECGGCNALPDPVGASCGRCGLGLYVCDGTDALRCDGGDASAAAPGGPLLIDDLEDGDRWIGPQSGLSGNWYTVADGSGGTLSPPAQTALQPTPDGAFGSAYRVRVQGSGFTDWGAGMALTLNAFGCTFDASAEQGIGFSIQGSGGTVTVSLATVATTPGGGIGSCVEPACNDHFAIDMPLSTAWTSRSVAFADLSQAGWGTPATFRPSDLIYIQFSFGAGATFDVSVDDLTFY
jgi:hypothetical protein